MCVQCQCYVYYNKGLKDYRCFGFGSGFGLSCVRHLGSATGVVLVPAYVYSPVVHPLLSAASMQQQWGGGISSLFWLTALGSTASNACSKQSYAHTAAVCSSCSLMLAHLSWRPAVPSAVGHDEGVLILGCILYVVLAFRMHYNGTLSFVVRFRVWLRDRFTLSALRADSWHRVLYIVLLCTQSIGQLYTLDHFPGQTRTSVSRIPTNHL